MKTIHKFGLQLQDEQTLEIPAGSKILCAQTQRNEIYLWAEVDTQAVMTKQTFYIRGTGHPLPEIPADYVGTLQVNNGTFVFHIYQKVPECFAVGQ